MPDDYENYYVFLDDGTGQGWQLRISESFKNAINLNGAVSYYDWYAGQPLPAFPKIHEGKPVTSLAYALSVKVFIKSESHQFHNQQQHNLYEKVVPDRYDGKPTCR